MIIWIASYPKSGNTWIRSIISLLLFSKDGIMQNFDLLNSIEQYPLRKHFLDLVKNYNDPIEIQKKWIPSQKIINQDKKIRFFKTHHIFCKYGNSAFTEVDKIIIKNDVKIMGETNILNKLPISASNLYAKNVFNFIVNLYDKENKKININLEDEIIEKTLIK